MRAWAIGCLLVLLAVDSGAAEKAKGPAEAKLLSLELQRGKAESYFQVRLSWPDEGVPDRHGRFVELSGVKFGHHDWPVDALELVPQDEATGRIFRLLSDGPEPVPAWRIRSVRPPREVAFVGRFVGRPKSLELRLRCPKADGSYRWLPLRLVLGKAKRAKGLKKVYWRAQADYLSTVRVPRDQSFYAYAWERLKVRLGKDGRKLALPRPIRGIGRRGLYEITTGGLALQESLQLDRMRDGQPDSGKRKIKVDDIAGVKVRSHPWQKMIGPALPAVDAEASLVPEDQYYIRFRTNRSFRRFFDMVHDWGGSLLGMVEVGGRDFGTKDKIEKQICIRASWLSDMLGPTVVESLVLTGGDPYLREGSDLSIIFHLKSVTLFEAAVGRYLDEARKANADLKESRFVHRGIEVQVLATPDRRVFCHRAKLGADYVVYANSPMAMKRIIDTFKGKLPSLAKSKDFVYMRKLYPQADKTEDGFIFLSDPWLRYMVGPRLRIAEKRRIEAMTSLEMIKNAALLYLWENPGKSVPSYAKLIKGAYLDPVQLRTERGDKFSWDAGTFQATSKRYGRIGYLKPNRELGINLVTEQEKQEYERFRDAYQDYWRRYFDPVGIRIRADKDLDIDMTILPLIDNSEYQRVKGNMGGKVVALEPNLRQGPVIFHWAGHLNPQGKDYRELQQVAVRMLPGQDKVTVEWIGEHVEFWVEDHPVLAAGCEHMKLDRLFQVPMVLAVEVKSKFGLAAFLVAFRSMVRTSAPGLVEFVPTEPYKKTVFTAIRAVPGGAAEQELAEAALYYGAVGDMLYLSTQLDALKKVVDARDQAASPQAVVKALGGAAEGHMGLRLHVDRAKHALHFVDLELGREAIEAERNHLLDLALVARTVGLGPEALAPAERVLGYRIRSVLGNSYRWLPAEGAVESSGNGTLWRFVAGKEIPTDSPLGKLLASIRSIRATVEFTEDGLHTQLGLRRR